MKKILFVNIVMSLFITSCVNKCNATESKSTESKPSEAKSSPAPAKMLFAKNTDKKTPAPPKKVFPQTWNTHNEKLFIFDPQIPGWAVYDDDGDLVRSGNASGGQDYCKDINEECRTITGKFALYEKRGDDCVSTKFPIETDVHPGGGAPMPYCMFFHGGYAIHGSNSVPNYNASHGCVRVTPSDAEWLNESFMEIGTRVLVLPYP